MRIGRIQARPGLGGFPSLAVGPGFGVTGISRYIFNTLRRKRPNFGTRFLGRVVGQIDAPERNDRGPLMRPLSMTLEDVIDFYSEGGRPNSYLDAEIRPRRFTPQEKRALAAFLRSLTGKSAKVFEIPLL